MNRIACACSLRAGSPDTKAEANKTQQKRPWPYARLSSL
jgi:hypothetical protein